MTQPWDAIVIGGAFYVQVSGFTVRNGRANDEGAGIRCVGGALGLYDSKVMGHRSELGGGGVWPMT